MSWWAQTIANTLRLNDEDEPDPHPDDHPHPDHDPDPERGVKEDLSELTKTLSRQFWGVASFLSPPPPEATAEPSDAAAGIRSDLAEIGGRFRSGISKLSGNIANTDFSKIVGTDFGKIASDLLLGTEEEEGEVAVGVNEETVAFARGVAMRPETWLDFPIPCDDDDEDDEFELSDAQQDHALAVESLAPRLAALRIELCPEYMSESSFWMIYFVLLHPRLSEHDAELLSTPEIMKARALLTQEMQNRSMGKSEENQTVRESYYSSDPNIEKQFSVPLNAQFESITLEAVPSEPGPSSLDHKFSTDKHPIPSSEVSIVDKSVIEEKPVNRLKELNINSGSSCKLDENSEDEADDWLKEESSDTGGTGTGTGIGTSTIPIENDEDVSFSDLEEDDGDTSTSYKKVTYGSDSSTRESRDWVQLSRSSTDSTKDINTVGSEPVSAPNSDTKESSDWLDLEEIDVE